MCFRLHLNVARVGRARMSVQRYHRGKRPTVGREALCRYERQTQNAIVVLPFPGVYLVSSLSLSPPALDFAPPGETPSKFTEAAYAGMRLVYSLTSVAKHRQILDRHAATTATNNDACYLVLSFVFCLFAFILSPTCFPPLTCRARRARVGVQPYDRRGAVQHRP